MLAFLPTKLTHRNRIDDSARALIDDSADEWVNYGEVRRRIEEARVFLKVENRGLVLCVLPRSCDGVIAYLSAVAAGHAVLLTEPESLNITELIEAYQPEWVFSPAPLSLSAYQERGWTFPSLKLYERKGEVSGAIHHDLFLTLLTSGSTGGHKGVRLSYHAIAHNTQAIMKSLDLQAGLTALAPLPLSYSFGLSVLHMQLTVGGACILSELSMMDKGFWALARKHQADLFAGVPYHYDMLMRLGLKRLKVPSLRCFLQAGGKMDISLTQKLLDEVRSLDKGALHIMYGQTEAGPRMTSFPLHKCPEKMGSAGRVLEEGQIISEDGELVYTGPNVMMGYAHARDDLCKGDECRGVLKTGDLGIIDGEGFITITGRKKRFAKLFGQRIALDDLELIAGKITPCLAVEGVDKVVLVCETTDQLLLKAAKQELIDHTSLPAPWVEVLSLDGFPRKGNGKIDYEAVKVLVGPAKGMA